MSDAKQRNPLPLATPPPPPLRADAARNRDTLLAAAAELFDRYGVEGVSLDQIVAAAGVGKGTLYRSFGDKSGLAVALLDERERDLQARILSGKPPLGPGAPPERRAAAFVAAYVRYVAGSLELVRMSQTSRPDARFDTGSHQFWRAHLVHLAREGGAARPQLAVDVVLAALTAEQIGAWLGRDGWSCEQLVHRLRPLAQRLLFA